MRAAQSAGVKIPTLEIPEAVWKVYPDLSHAHDWEAAIEATSFVPDDVVAERMVKALPRGRLVEIPRAVHTLHEDNPEAVLAALRDFLEF